MKKYCFVFTLLIFVFFVELTSCKDTVLDEGSFVGVWVSTRVDTLTQYIEPVKPDAFVSYEMKNCPLDIKADGTFQMIESKDTLPGKIWNSQETFILELANSNSPFNIFIVSFKDRNNLIINCSVRRILPGESYYEDRNITISKHYIRK